MISNIAEYAMYGFTGLFIAGTIWNWLTRRAAEKELLRVRKGFKDCIDDLTPVQRGLIKECLTKLLSGKELYIGKIERGGIKFTFDSENNTIWMFTPKYNIGEWGDSYNWDNKRHIENVEDVVFEIISRSSTRTMGAAYKMQELIEKLDVDSEEYKLRKKAVEEVKGAINA